MRSDIFDEYAKIAEKMGLVSLAEDDLPEQPSKPKESAKLKKYKKSPYPRAGSDDISTIEALYGVKPDDSIKYEYNIMEAAHPRPVVIAPAYDRMNALVENENERNNIICNIVSKPVDGLLNFHRWAKKDLMLQLVRLANDLDNAGHEELRCLADKCIEKVSSEKKKFRKEADISDWINSGENWLKEKGQDVFQTVKGYGTGALFGGILGGIIGAVAGEGIGAIPGFITGARFGGIAGGLTASIARTAPQVISISNNAKDTISQIQDLVVKIQNTTPVNTTELNFLTNFQAELNNLSTLSDQYNELVSNIQNTNPTSDKGDAQDAHSLTTNLLNSMDKIDQYSKIFNQKADRKVYEQFLMHSKLLTPVYEFISNDVEDVQDSIKSLSLAMNNFKSTMSAVHNNAKDVANSAPPANQENTMEEQQPEEEQNETNPEYEEISQLIGHEPSDRELAFFRSLK
jgi:hypothetical protein